MPDTVVEISANVEWQALLDIVRPEETYHSPFGEWFVLPAGPNAEPVIVFHGGWGKIAAAAATQYAIERWKPLLLVNLGTCGGFAGHVERGTIILAEKTVVYDIVEQMGDYDSHIAHYTTVLDLSWLQEPYPQSVLRTVLVSGDRDLRPQDIPWLQERFGAVAGDWESGAIAWVAARHRVRTLILRGVSDLVSEEGGEAYEDMNVFIQNTHSIMAELWHHLPAWLHKLEGAHPKW